MVSVLCLLIQSEQLWAGTVRTIYIDSTTMAPINLRMGESTVLRFPEKPKKVVLGNSNYYSIEFIDNDVAIQPQGAVATNLFVYGTKSVYGFLLKNTGQGAYDDLVQVRWKEAASTMGFASSPSSVIHEVSRPNLIFKLVKLNVAVLKIQRFEKRDFYIIDLGFQNPSLNAVSLEDLKVSASGQKIKFSPQEFVLKDKTVSSGKTTYGRLFVNLPKQKSFSMNLRLKKVEVQQTVAGKFL